MINFTFLRKTVYPHKNGGKPNRGKGKMCKI